VRHCVRRGPDHFLGGAAVILIGIEFATGFLLGCITNLKELAIRRLLTTA